MSYQEALVIVTILYNEIKGKPETHYQYCQGFNERSMLARILMYKVK